MPVKSHHQRMLDQGWTCTEDRVRYERSVGRAVLKVWKAPARGFGYAWSITVGGGNLILAEGGATTLITAGREAEAATVYNLKAVTETGDRLAEVGYTVNPAPAKPRGARRRMFVIR